MRATPSGGPSLFQPRSSCRTRALAPVAFLGCGKLQTPLTLLAGDLLRSLPPRREVELLLGAAVRAHARCTFAELRGAEALEELKDREDEEAGDEQEMRDGDEH